MKFVKFVLSLFAISLLSQAPIAADECKVKNVNSGISYTDLQTAINDANPGETLKVGCKCVGNFFIDKTLIIKGSGEKSILDGAQAGTVVTIGCNPVEEQEGFGPIVVVLKYLTIQNGKSSSNGGGVINNNATVILDHVNICANAADCNGGGVYTNGGTTILTRSEVESNCAENGGGFFFDNCSTAILTHAYIAKNYAKCNGGGIYQTGSDTLVSINLSEIEKNTASRDGGGAYNAGYTASFSETSISDNCAGDTGGGVYNSSGAELNLIETSFDDNKPNDLIDF